MPAIPSPSGTTAKNSGCLTLFGVPFALVGVIMAVTALKTTDPEQVFLRATVGVIFSGLGFGLMIYSVNLKRSAAKLKTLVDRSPDKPWLWREDWAAGYSLPEWKQTSTLYAVIGVGLILIVAPIYPGLSRELLVKRRYETLVALVFPLCGLYLIGQSLMSSLRSRKFRDLRFTLSTVPGVVGGRLKGQIQAAFTLPPEQTADLVLSCVRSYVSGSGDGDARWETVLWQDRKAVQFYSDGHQCYLPVDVPIPYDARETDSSNADDSILWRLAANANLPGLDFRVSFLAPVFKTAASDTNQTIALLDAHNEKHAAGTMPVDSKIATSQAPDGGVRFYFAPGRNKKIAAMLTIFGVIFLGGGLFFGYVSAQLLTWFVGFIPLTISGGIGLLLLAIALWLWFGATTIEVVRRELHIRSGYFGISRSRVIAASDIRNMDLHAGMQQGNDVWYDLKVRLANGRSVTAGSAMLKPEAEWFRAELKKDLGIRD